MYNIYIHHLHVCRLKPVFSSAFKRSLLEMKWPQSTRNAPLHITYEAVKRFSSLFVCLLDVQLVTHTLTHIHTQTGEEKGGLPELWAVDLLVEVRVACVCMRVNVCFRSAHVVIVDIRYVIHHTHTHTHI
jgi:hypothetical protein